MNLALKYATEQIAAIREYGPFDKDLSRAEVADALESILDIIAPHRHPLPPPGPTPREVHLAEQAASTLEPCEECGDKPVRSNGICH